MSLCMHKLTFLPMCTATCYSVVLWRKVVNSNHRSIFWTWRKSPINVPIATVHLCIHKPTFPHRIRFTFLYIFCMDLSVYAISDFCMLIVMVILIVKYSPSDYELIQNIYQMNLTINMLQECIWIIRFPKNFLEW